MHDNNIPTFVLRRLRALAADAKRFEEAATEAEREAERRRVLANTGRNTEETKARQQAFDAAREHALQVRALANAERRTHDGCEALIKQADNRCKIEEVVTDTAGRDLPMVRARLKELDKEIRALEVAFVPATREQIAAYVSRVGAKFERGMDLRVSGGELQTRFPVDFYNELEPDWWRLKCAMEPAAAIDWLMRLSEQRASVPLPVDQRASALEKLSAEKLSLQHVESALVDAVRADPGALQVMRDPGMPPQCVLGIKVTLPSSERVAA
jgi:hypothetical protein